MVKEKKNVLFIARNIPISDRTQGNKIIFTIAEQLSENYSVDFFFPKSRVPWGMHFLKKHAPLYNLKDWTYKAFSIYAIPFIHLPGYKFTYWLFNRLPKRAIKLFETKKYDLIHAHYGMPDGYLAYLLYKRYNVPYVITLRSHDLRHLQLIEEHNLDYIKYKKVLSHASKICVLNSHIQKIVNIMGYASEILPHGIKERTLDHLNSQKDTTIHIACVSQYVERKNIEWIIDAYLAYRGTKNIELIIVGDMEDMPEKYKNKCTENSIQLKGKIPNDEVFEILNQSDIFVLPSVMETFGLVYIEAASMKNAIIGHMNEGVCGVLEEEKEMLFAKDFNDFKSKLEYLIENDDVRHTLANHAREKSKLLTWNKIAHRYENTYENAMNTPD